MASHHDYVVGYIGGSDRSGSTILDMMLGAHPEAFSTGQLDELQFWVNSARFCTCGRPILECPFWGQVLASSDILVPQPINVNGKIRKVGRMLRVAAAGATRDEARGVESAWELLDHVAERSGKRLVIDSSKAGLRLVQLARDRRGKQLRVIHLVRDTRGYVTSKSFPTLAKSPQGTAGYIATQSKPAAVADWLVQNLLMLLLGVVVFRRRYVVVTYEQMTRNPERILAQLSRFLSLQYDRSMLPPLDRSEFHLIGGNSSRLSFAEVRYDDKWRSKLTSREKVLIKAASGWLYWLLARLAARHQRAPIE
jgi:hypothetical protein